MDTIRTRGGVFGISQSQLYVIKTNWVSKSFRFKLLYQKKVQSLLILIISSLIPSNLGTYYFRIRGYNCVLTSTVQQDSPQPNLTHVSSIFTNTNFRPEAKKQVDTIKCLASTRTARNKNGMVNYQIYI